MIELPGIGNVLNRLRHTREAWRRGDDAPFPGLVEWFTTTESAPIATPRKCQPGLGQLIVPSDSGNHMSISAGGVMVLNGAAGSWGSSSWYAKTSGGAAFPRGQMFEITFTRTADTYFQYGWSNSTTLTEAALKHVLYIVGDYRFRIQSQGDSSAEGVTEYVGVCVTNVAYTIRIITLPSAGALFLIKGGHWGTDFRVLGYTLLQNDAALYPTFMNYNGQLTMDNVKVIQVDTPPLYVGYYNGCSAATPAYQIGRALSLDGILCGRFLENPVMSKGTGWESSLVKDPWVLLDGNTYKMWYSGTNGTTYKIGYATSTDGISWTKSGSNPVLSVGAGGTWDANGVQQPCVYKDNAADASKRWKMFYNGVNAGGTQQIGYAYSADGISWTKGVANPVIAVGAGGQWDSVACIFPSLYKEGSTYYLYYDGRDSSSFPVTDQIGLVTFTDFEGVYTKSGSNPILARRTQNQALTANTALGSSIVTVADTTGFVANEHVVLGETGKQQENWISSVDSGTQITLKVPVLYAFTTALSAHITPAQPSIVPRQILLEAGTYKMFGSAYNGGGTSSLLTESTFYATGTAPDAGWAFQDLYCPLMGWAMNGDANGWDTISTENLVFVLDADLFQRIRI